MRLAPQGCVASVVIELLVGRSFQIVDRSLFVAMNSSPSEDEVNSLLLVGSLEVEEVVEDSNERPEDPNKATCTSAAACVQAKIPQIVLAIVVAAVTLISVGGINMKWSDTFGRTNSMGSSSEQLPPTKPEVAWLMSYPNSGTSYTLRVVKDASRFATASNYGHNVDEVTGTSIPLYDSVEQGPFLHHGSVPPEETFILTKTHCGGRCTNCPLSKSLETVDSFSALCMSGTVITNHTTVTRGVRLKYDQHVKRAIHLIRDPFDNVVARFHLENKGHPTEGYDDRAAFQEYCKDRDALYQPSDLKMSQITDDVKALFPGLPCYDQFYQYAQWHSLAIETISNKEPPIRSMVFHYDNYQTDFDASLQRLLEFLGFKQQSSELTPFIAGKTYHEYFSADERHQAWELMKAVASPQAWELMKRYLQESL